MKRNVLLSIAVNLLMFSMISIPAAAQASQEEGYTATTIGDPEIATENLELILKPLFKEELAIEAGAWLKLLREMSGEVNGLLFQAQKAEGEAKTKLTEEAQALRDKQNFLVERINLVLFALEAKGGEVDDYKKYVSEASGFSYSPKSGDINTMWVVITGWLTSETGGIKVAKDLGTFIGYIIAFWILAAILARLTRKALTPLKKTSDLLKDFFVNSVRNITIIVGIVVALPAIGVQPGPVLAAMGIAGFIIGFALQDTLGNFASGIMILFYRPYDIGDVVSVAGVTGKVEAMSLVSTTISTFDNQVMVVPNGSIWGGIITNITGNETRRVDMVFGIGYEDDIAKAQGILEEIINNHPLVLKDPEPVIKLHELADSSVNFIARPWSKTSDYWSVYWDVTRKVKERFDEEGVSIPFPQRDVHVYQAVEA
ncbi:MAG: mechanosensitive ion channel family protein [Planctomycetota bacterium]